MAGYNVYRVLSIGGEFTKLNAQPVTDTRYTDTNVEEGASYVYRVTSVDSKGVEGPPSERATAKIPKPWWHVWN